MGHHWQCPRTASQQPGTPSLGELSHLEKEEDKQKGRSQADHHLLVFPVTACSVCAWSFARADRVTQVHWSTNLLHMLLRSAPVWNSTPQRPRSHTLGLATDINSRRAKTSLPPHKNKRSSVSGEHGLVLKENRSEIAPVSAFGCYLTASYSAV